MHPPKISIIDYSASQQVQSCDCTLGRICRLFLLSCSLGDGPERGAPGEHLKGHNANCPDVHRRMVRLAVFPISQHLEGHFGLRTSKYREDGICYILLYCSKTSITTATTLSRWRQILFLDCSSVVELHDYHIHEVELLLSETVRNESPGTPDLW